MLELATLIAHQARYRPDATAVVFGQERLTYAQFGARVARGKSVALARHRQRRQGRHGAQQLARVARAGLGSPGCRCGACAVVALADGGRPCEPAARLRCEVPGEPALDAADARGDTRRPGTVAAGTRAADRRYGGRLRRLRR